MTSRTAGSTAGSTGARGAVQRSLDAAGRRLPVDPARPNRLTYDDDLFWRARRVLGIPVVNQTVWRLPEPVPADWLAAFHRGFADGPLTRLAVRPSVPGARPRWVRGVAAPLPEVVPGLPGVDVLDWMDEAAAVDLDPERGPTWSLAAATTVEGEGLLSLVTSHVVCDGGAHVGAAVAAAEHASRAVAPAPARRLPVDDLAVLQVRRRHDARDALHRLRAAGRGVLEATRAPRPASTPDVLTSSTHPPTPPRGGADAAPYRPPTAVVTTSAPAWHAAARAAGGTANSLLVALGVELLVRGGRVPAGASVKVALPVDTRGADDLRANATTGVSIVVDVDADGRVRDLAQVRTRSREAFAGLAAGTRRDPLEPVKPLLQLLPDVAVARLARGSAVPLCLCSNLGRLGPVLRAPYGVEADAVAMRSVTQNATPDLMRSRRGGLTSWWAEHGGTATHAVLGLDPDCWPDLATLQRHVREVYAGWGLTPSAW